VLRFKTRTENNTYRWQKFEGPLRKFHLQIFSVLAETRNSGRNESGENEV